MEQAYLLKTGYEFCADADEEFGIYTDKDKLKEGIDILQKWRRSERCRYEKDPDIFKMWDDDLKIFVVVFPLNRFSGELQEDYSIGRYETYIVDEPSANWRNTYKPISELL